MTAAYLDTSVAVWLAQGDLTRVTPTALDSIRSCNLLVSPMVALELAYLHEINRITLTSQDVLLKLRAELGVEVCDSCRYASSSATMGDTSRLQLLMESSAVDLMQ